MTGSDSLQASTTSTIHIQKLFSSRITSCSFFFSCIFFHLRRWRNKCAELRHLIGILDYRFAFFFSTFFLSMRFHACLLCQRSAGHTRMCHWHCVAIRRTQAKWTYSKWNKERSSTALTIHHPPPPRDVNFCGRMCALQGERVTKRQHLVKRKWHFFQFVSLILL